MVRHGLSRVPSQSQRENRRAQGSSSRSRVQSYPFPVEIVIHDGKEIDASVLVDREPERIARLSRILIYRAIPERGFSDICNSEFVDFRRIASRMGLTDFVQQPAHGYRLRLVQEFYANLRPEPITQTVWVRGVEVRVSSEVIREFYGVPEVDDCHYQYLRREAKKNSNELDAIQSTLRREPLHPGTYRGSSIQFSELTDLAKVWYHFISRRLFPTITGTRIPFFRLLCVYCFVIQERIDVGRLIYEQMTEVGLGDAKSLRFPCLITSLCSRAKVPGITLEAECRAGPHMDDIFLGTIYRGLRTPAAPFQVREESDTSDEDEDEGSDQVATSTQPLPSIARERPAKRVRDTGISDPASSEGPSDLSLADIAEEVDTLRSYVGDTLSSLGRDLHTMFSVMATRLDISPETVPAFTVVPPPGPRRRRAETQNANISGEGMRTSPDP